MAEAHNFLKLQEQYMQLKGQLEAIQDWHEISHEQTDPELAALQEQEQQLQSKLTVSQQQYAASCNALDHWRSRNEELNDSNIYERWRQVITAMRAITTKCDREERLYHVLNEIDEKSIMKSM